MASGTLGIRAISTSGDVLEFHGSGAQISCTKNSQAYSGGLTNLCLIAFYRPGDASPHLVFSCRPQNSRVSCSGAAPALIYDLVVDFLCPFLKEFPQGPAQLVWGTYHFVIGGAGAGLFGNGVLFQQARFYLDRILKRLISVWIVSILLTTAENSRSTALTGQPRQILSVHHSA